MRTQKLDGDISCHAPTSLQKHPHHPPQPLWLCTVWQLHVLSLPNEVFVKIKVTIILFVFVMQPKMTSWDPPIQSVPLTIEWLRPYHWSVLLKCNGNKNRQVNLRVIIMLIQVVFDANSAAKSQLQNTWEVRLLSILSLGFKDILHH